MGEAQTKADSLVWRGCRTALRIIQCGNRRIVCEDNYCNDRRSTMTRGDVASTKASKEDLAEIGRRRAAKSSEGSNEEPCLSVPLRRREIERANLCCEGLQLVDQN